MTTKDQSDTHLVFSGIFKSVNPTPKKLTTIIDRYIERPHSLKDVCLAEYVSNYSWLSKKIIKCRKSKIIRFVHFNKYKDVEN